LDNHTNGVKPAAPSTGLVAELQNLAGCERRLRSALLAGDQDRQHSEHELHTAIAQLKETLSIIQQDVAELRSYPGAVGRAISKRLDYDRIVVHVREAVNLKLPLAVRVLVISKGDDDLLELNGREGMHFLQDPQGGYAGYHPADSADAKGALETLRARGAQFLVIPSTAFWWLGHYADFGKHLESSYRRLHADRHCMIYDLRHEGLFRRLLKRLLGARGAWTS